MAVLRLGRWGCLLSACLGCPWLSPPPSIRGKVYTYMSWSWCHHYYWEEGQTLRCIRCIAVETSQKHHRFPEDHVVPLILWDLWKTQQNTSCSVHRLDTCSPLLQWHGPQKHQMAPFFPWNIQEWVKNIDGSQYPRYLSGWLTWLVDRSIMISQVRWWKHLAQIRLQWDPIRGVVFPKELTQSNTLSRRKQFPMPTSGYIFTYIYLKEKHTLLRETTRWDR